MSHAFGAPGVRDRRCRRKGGHVVDVPVPTLVGQSVVVERDAVRILDRRVFPFERSWVTCHSYEDVAKAIEDMVTQSLGPLFAAMGGMTLAGRAADPLPPEEAGRLMTEAGRRLVATRPTNNGIRDAVTDLLAAASAALAGDQPLAATVERAAGDLRASYLARYRALGEHAAVLIPDGATVLTHCWAETYLTE